MASCSTKRNVGEAERLACLGLGTLLLLRGIVSRRTSTTLLGGLLVYRGTVGRCLGYEFLGLDTRRASERLAQD